MPGGRSASVFRPPSFAPTEASRRVGTTRFDVAVIGLGSFGSAAAYHLARSGLRVVGFDRFTPPHDQGSHHGGSRIIREAYFEDPAYVPFVQRAYALWAELERAVDRRLFHPGGGLLMGIPGGEVVPGARRAARTHRLALEELDRSDVRRRFPGFDPGDGLEAVYEPRAGTLLPEECIRAHLGLAKKHGAQLRPQEPAERWLVQGSGVHLWTPEGEYDADRLVVAGGAWLGRILHDLGLALTVERQVQFWFQPKPGPQDWRPPACPIFAIEPERGHLFYGLPDLGEGVKAAVHHDGEPADPARLDRAVRPHEEEAIRSRLRTYAPALDSRLLRTAVCMYTNTPDRHFLIDRHPEHDEVVIAGGGSGHGFKFASAVGEAVAGLVQGARRPDLGLFGVDRLLAPR